MRSFPKNKTHAEVSEFTVGNSNLITRVHFKDLGVIHFKDWRVICFGRLMTNNFFAKAVISHFLECQGFS